MGLQETISTSLPSTSRIYYTYYANQHGHHTSSTSLSIIMPVHPSEEEAPTGLTEKIAKDPSSTTESTASDHESHQNEHTPGDSLKASAQDFQSKGPQIPLSMDGLSFSEK